MAANDGTAAKPGFLVAAEVEPVSPCIGRGVFAAQSVPSGMRMWVPGLVQQLSPTEAAEQLSCMALDAAHELLRQAFVTPTDPDHLCVNPADVGRYMNHSASPNCMAGMEGGTALRDIAAGEELTCDYAQLACPPWYLALCERCGVKSTADVVRECVEAGNG